MKTVLVTGGSSGIGFEMSRIFGKNNYRILWVSKFEKELKDAKALLEKETPNVEIHFFEKDLTQPEAASDVLSWSKKIAPVDVLINNAGFGTYGFFEDLPLEKELEVIQLNVMNVVRMTHLFLNEMNQKNIGTIINISSNSSFQPVARMNIYASTKAFVTHFSRGLQEEQVLKKSKVRILTICPSAIADTAFRISNKMNNVRTFKGLATTTASEVANDVWKGFQNGKTFVVTGWKMRFLYAIRNFMPYSFQQFLVRKETEVE